MTGIKLSTVWACPAIVSVAFLAAGCAQSGTAAQQPETRRAVETAPADLQLACAAEVSRLHGVAPERVLPVASFVEGAGTYRVELLADAQRTGCSIDQNGNILSTSMA